jgi:hypothetical protein
MDPQTEDPTTTLPEGAGAPEAAPEPALEPLPDLDAPPARPSGGGSLLDALRGQREQIAQRAQEGDDYLDIDVAGYEHPNGVASLFVRYEYPEGGWGRIQKMQESAQGSRDPLALLYVHAGIVSACTRQILGREPDGTEKNFDPDGETLRFDRRLAALLRIEIPAEVQAVNRYVVRQTFSPEQVKTGEYKGDVAVSAHAIRVAHWLETRQGGVNEDFVGES